MPRNALDVLSQQIVAACATDELAGRRPVRARPARVPVPRAAAGPVRRRARHAVGPLPVRRLRRAAAAHRLGPRSPAASPAGRTRRPLAVANAGTIPDRGLFGVFLADGSGRVGELDEEMVYEARVGQVFVLGASSWRIERITRDRVLVSPAPGQPGQIPFWKGEAPGRPVELGRAIGVFVRETGALTEARAVKRLVAEHDLDDRAAAQPVALPARPARRHAACCRRTARSSSSGSATRSATGASASCRRSAAASTRRGRSRWARCCASGSAPRRRRCGRTTASCCTCPTPTSRRPPT